MNYSTIDNRWRGKSTLTTTSPSTFGLALVGDEKIPVLRGPSEIFVPERLEVFTNWKSAVNSQGTVLHFYVDDARQEYAVNNPLKWVDRLSKASAVISPHLSLSFHDAPCVRRVNTRNNRIAAAKWEDRGLEVIPNVRWNDEEDYRFCFDGLPRKSLLAISSVTMMRASADVRNLVHGFQEMLERLEPVQVIWHGRIPVSLPKSSLAKTEIVNFASRLDKVFNKDQGDGWR